MIDEILQNSLRFYADESAKSLYPSGSHAICLVLIINVQPKLQTFRALMCKIDIIQAPTKPRRSEDPTRPSLGQEECCEQTSP